MPVAGEEGTDEARSGDLESGGGRDGCRRTSLRSEEGGRHAFRRDAAAERPPVTVPKSRDGAAWR